VSRIITLTTDFGTRDAYVAAMKGTILTIAPEVRLVDITHDISPQDVMEAAFVLQGAVPFFPPDAIHLAVVDPGVGTDRRPVALRQGNHFFVGPDNGLFPLLFGDEVPDDVVILDRPAFWRSPGTSSTFHGRDVFAPTAAHLAAGRDLNELGTAAGSLRPLHWALPIADEQGIQGWVVHIDHFGNCITNISRALFEQRRLGRPVKCYAGNAILERIDMTYALAETGEPLLLFNSSDYLEIAVNTGNAADLLGIRKGAPVNVLFRDPR
jgi:S-adenosyl-L-methionine hydrolase (adenosine-forming)